MPAGVNLSALPPSEVINGNTLSLQGNVVLSGSLNVPAGSPGLTINGNGNTITVSNGAFALPMNAAPNLSLEDVTITGGNNASLISGSNLQGVNIPITGAVTFSNINAPQNGSAIGVTSNGKVAVGSSGSTVVFTGNIAAQNGGAIFTTNASVAISGNAIFAGNTATSGYGGAISSTGIQSFEINGPMIEFTGNTAGLGGGAVRVQNNSVIINDAVDGDITFSNNTALGGNGGAIDEQSNSVLIGGTGSTVVITGNKAAKNGGGIFSQNNSIVVDGQVTLSNNTAAGGNGGALDEESQNVSVGSAGSTVVVTGNTATANGGAIHSLNVGVTVNGANITLQQNSAGGNGGALYEGSGPVTVSDVSGATVSIISNTALDRSAAAQSMTTMARQPLTAMQLC